jgi:hypothetical protein
VKGAENCWGRSLYRHGFSCSGVSELESVGVQEGSGAGRAPVKFVSQEGVSQGGQLDTYLVGATRVGMDFEEGNGVGECVRESF